MFTELLTKFLSNIFNEISSNNEKQIYCNFFLSVKIISLNTIAWNIFINWN